MDLSAIVDSMKSCPCGREHTLHIKAVEIGSGMLERTAEILSAHSFPKKILVVADTNTLKASEGILSVLKKGGFECGLKLYEDLRVADRREAEIITEMAMAYEGILSVGSGSLNDICRLAALQADREFAIFATAPSMDGFASNSSPITANNFKTTVPARQPSIIIADTRILAEAPLILKGAGFGDMIAKYTALADWKISHLVTGEHYCENVAAVTKNALDRVVSLADKVSLQDEEAAGAIMEALVLTGLAMKLGDSVRPASGTEHIIAHFWEIKKLEQGVLSDFHGRKVVVGTLYATKIYKQLAACPNMVFHEDKTDWDKVYEVYGPNFSDEVKKLNSPTVTSETSPECLRENWPEICRIVNEELPSYEELTALVRKAGAAENLDDIAVSPELGVLGLQYHPYMRHRMTLARLIPMMDYTVDYESVISR